MVDFQSPGVKVREKRQEPLAPIANAATVGGMQGKAQKGPVNQPIQTTSLDEVREVYGDNISDSFLMDSAAHFFQNGGRILWINRIAHYSDITDPLSCTAVAAMTEFDTTTGGATSGSDSTSVGAFPVQLADGDTFTASVDAGGTVTLTITATSATKTGAAASYAAGAGGDSVTVKIGNITTVVSLATAAATQAGYLAAINSQLLNGRAEDAAGQIRLVSDALGNGATGEILAFGGAAAAKTGLSVGAFTNGTGNVVNVLEVGAEELAALFTSTFVGSTATGDDETGTMVWASNTTGASSSVQLTAGTGVAKVAGLDNALHSGSAAGAGVPTLEVSASSPGAFANVERVSVTKVDTVACKVGAVVAAGALSILPVSNVSRLIVGDTVSITSGGDTQRGVIAAIDATQKTVTFVSPITVPVGGYTTADNVIQETFNMSHIDSGGLVTFTFTGIRMSSLADRYYVETLINGTTRSPIEVVNLALTPSGSLDPRPATTSGILLGLDTAGSDGGTVVDSDYIGDSAAKTGLRAWDDLRDFIMLSQPGVTSTNAQLGLEAYAEERQDFFAVQEVPLGLDPQNAVTYVTQTANFASSFEAIWYPWVKAVDVRTGLGELFPPCGFIQGMIARVHRERNFGKAPAGITDGRLLGAVGLEREVSSPTYDTLYPKNINAILKFEGAGICAFGSRTLDPLGDFRQINVRFVFLFVRRDFEVRTRFAAFEPNNKRTRGRVVRTMTVALRDLRTAEILQGESDDEAFFIICDETNNTATVRKSGKLKARVGLAVTEPSEFIEITLEQDTRAIDAELAGA